MYTAKGRLDNSSLIKQYSPLVRRLAHQMIAKLPANVELDDLMQVLVASGTERAVFIGASNELERDGWAAVATV